MADDRAGQPFDNGEEPSDSEHGAKDDAFDSVVLDERFVRAAVFHEPTAAERTLAAAQSRAESEPPDEFHSAGWGSGRGRRSTDADQHDAYEPGYGGFDEDGYASFRDEEDYREYEAYQRFRDSEDTPGYRAGGQARWHRPVAWVLAVVMGVGVVAMAFAAVYRSGAGDRSDPTPPPATTGVDSETDDRGPLGLPTVPGDPRGPAASVASGVG